MSGAVPGAGVGAEEHLDRSIGKLELIDKVLEKGERGKCIVEGIVPAPIRGQGGELIESECGAEIAQGMGRLGRPSRAGQLQGVDPRAERMAGEGAQESLFGAVSMGHHRTAGKGSLHHWPEG